MLQDHLGFLWFGTVNGLVRYDGYEMKLYQSEASNPGSLAENYINQIFEDKQGTIWAGTNRGLKAVVNRFERATETFKQYSLEPNDSSAKLPNLVLSFFEDSKGRFWVGTMYGLILLERKTGKVRQFYYRQKEFNPSDIESQFITTINEDRLTGDLLIGGIPGLWKLDEKNEVISQIPFSMFIYNIRAFYQLNDGSILIATSRGLYKYNSNPKKIKIYLI